MSLFVLNGWAAGPEIWDGCTFARDRIFSYLDQLDGLPERELENTDSAFLVGFSMGGSGALRLFLRHPEKIRGMVLVSATPRMMEDRESGWRGMSPRRIEALRLGTLMTIGDDPSPLYREDSLDRGLAYLRETDLRAALRETAAQAVRTGRRSLPVRIFQSERDGIVRPSNADFLNEIFPEATVVRVPGGEHSLPVTIPRQIDAAVSDMMDEMT